MIRVHRVHSRLTENRNATGERRCARCSALAFLPHLAPQAHTELEAVYRPLNCCVC